MPSAVQSHEDKLSDGHTWDLGCFSLRGARCSRGRSLRASPQQYLYGDASRGELLTCACESVAQSDRVNNEMPTLQMYSSVQHMYGIEK